MIQGWSTCLVCQSFMFSPRHCTVVSGKTESDALQVSSESSQAPILCYFSVFIFNFYVCMYVCVCKEYIVYIPMCVYQCMYVYNVCVRVYVCVPVYVCIYCVPMNVCMYVYDECMYIMCVYEFMYVVPCVFRNPGKSLGHLELEL